MREESTTPDPLETARRSLEAFNRRDLDAAIDMWAPDAVWELAPDRMGLFEMKPPTGHAVIRKLWEEYPAAFDDFQLAIEEAHALSNGVTFHVVVERGRPRGGSGLLERHYGFVATWRDGQIARAKNYLDIDEARAAAERLAKERG
ncbi:MAG: nuclear transport factor 2 family protein [Solirubrobacteraceae bacterium]